MHPIEKLIISGRLEEALEKMMNLADDYHRNSLILLLGRVNSLQRDVGRGVVTSEFAGIQTNRIASAVQDTFKDMKKDGLIPDEVTNGNDPAPEVAIPSTQGQGAKVFISYNHGDKAVADQVVSKLKEHDIEVIIDSEAMRAGEKITSFIEDCIRKSDITLSIVSNKSLLSSWVSMETVNTFYAQKTNDKRFIACFLDADFFDNDYLLDNIPKIDEQLKEINEKIPKYIELKLSTVDLDDEKARLYKLRNNLGDILRHLRNSLSIDIRSDQFDAGMDKVIQEVQP